MNKFQVTLVQTKTLVIEVDAKSADAAARAVKKAVGTAHSFDKRIGAVLVADVRELSDE